MAARESITVPAIYENGQFRPLEVPTLSEHTKGTLTFEVVEVTTGAEDATDISDEEFEALLAVGGVHLVKMPTDGLRMLTDEEQDALDRRIGPGRPLSEIILEERDGI